MASITTVVENVESTPNVAALSQMTNPIVMVTKINKIGNTKNEQLVINAQTGLTTPEILKLQDQLPLGTVFPNSGPGYYKFDVTDQDSAAKMVWQVRLGGAAIENPPAGSPPRATTSPFAMLPAPTFAPAQPQPPLAAGAQHLGNGWVYNPNLEILTAPDGTMHQWRKGMPLPQLQTAPTSTFAGPATPIGTPMFGAPNPEIELMRQQLAQTQAALNDAREREREAARQAEIRDLQARMERTLEENNKRFEALVAQLATPKTDDNRVVEMERRLAEKERLDSLRAENKAQIDTLTTMVQSQANKGPDPVIQVLMGMLTQVQKSADDNIRAMRELSSQERMAMKDQVLTPERLFSMIERQALLTKDSDKSDVVNKVLSGVDMIYERMMRLNQMEREMSGGGGGVDWLSVIRESVGKAGSAFSAYQQAKAKEAGAQQAQAQAQIAVANANVVATRARQAQGRPTAPPAVRSVPAAVATAAAEGTAPAPAPAAPVLTSVPAAPAPTPAKGKKGGKDKPRATVVEPQLSDATIVELRALFKGETDEAFFGTFMEYVQQLRDEVDAKPGEVSADDIAGYVLEAREFLASEAKAGNIPHAAELLAHNQLAYVLERILPTVNEGLRSEIVKAIRRMLATEADARRIAAAAQVVEGADEGGSAEPAVS